MKIRDLKWRGLLLFFQSIIFVANLYGSVEDAVMKFSTPGPDFYADMHMVADGECYALVWSPAGTVFSGFNADGTPASPNDRIVIAAPLAKNGRCPDVYFQVPADIYKELEGGEWAVCLLDTRNALGVTSGVSANRPRRVNRWGVVKGGLVLEPKAVASPSLVSAARLRSGASTTSHGGTQAGIVSEVPAYVEAPEITSIEVTDGLVKLAVTGTVPYLTYTLSSGDSPDGLVEDLSADLVDGDPNGEIEIAAPRAEGGRFFKVTRAR
jgi:hypothetical protein